MFPLVRRNQDSNISRLLDLLKSRADKTVTFYQMARAIRPAAPKSVTMNLIKVTLFHVRQRIPRGSAIMSVRGRGAKYLAPMEVQS